MTKKPYTRHVLPQLPVITVTPAMLDDLRQRMNETDVSLSALIRRYIAEGLARETGADTERYAGIKHGDPARLPDRQPTD